MLFPIWHLVITTTSGVFLYFFQGRGNDDPYTMKNVVIAQRFRDMNVVDDKNESTPTKVTFENGKVNILCTPVSSGATPC